MLRFQLGGEKHTLQKVLCLGAHSDDIEIGCGGTILRLQQEHRDLEFWWVVFSATPSRRKEALASAKLFMHSAEAHVIVKQFRDGFFPFEGAKIKEVFEELKKSVSPDLIFTHFRKDLHQDHRLICELTWNTFRDHLIMEYEIPKYDGDLASPNCFVGIPQSLCTQKISHILKAFTSQKEKQWFTEETFRAMLRIRGMESNAPERYAEGFYCCKALL
jgi:LmbE family N-acetylglucosaminyl deacetylase